MIIIAIHAYVNNVFNYLISKVNWKKNNNYHIHIPFKYNYPIIIYSMFRLIYLVEFDPPTQIVIHVPKISYFTRIC